MGEIRIRITPCFTTTASPTLIFLPSSTSTVSILPKKSLRVTFVPLTATTEQGGGRVIFWEEAPTNRMTMLGVGSRFEKAPACFLPSLRSLAKPWAILFSAEQRPVIHSAKPSAIDVTLFFGITFFSFLENSAWAFPVGTCRTSGIGRSPAGVSYSKRMSFQ